MKTLFCMLLLLVLPSILAHQCMKEGSNLFPHGIQVHDIFTPKEDDGASDKIHLHHSFIFLEKLYRTCYVNNNGAISFELPVTEYTPDSFPLHGPKIICPFWGDVDNERDGNITYRQVKDKSTLVCISSFVNKYFLNINYTAIWALIATWHKVPYHGSESDRTNTFQTVLVSDERQRCLAMFLYEEITWTTGTASGGDPLTGRGGTPAQAGFNTGEQYFNMPMSRTDHIINIVSTSNVGRPGVWIFRVDHLIAPGGCIHKDTFMSRGNTVWMDATCGSKCFCKHDGRVECEDKGCDEELVCKPQGRFYACQINEEDC